MDMIVNFLENIAKSGITSNLSFAEQRSIKITNIIAIIAIFIGILLTPIDFYLKSNWALLIINLLILFIFHLVIFFNSKYKYDIARITLFMLFNAFFFCIPLITKEYSGSNIAFMVLLVSSILVLKKPLSTIFFVLSSILMVLSSYLTALPNKNIFQLTINEPIFFTALFASISLMYLILNAFRKENENYQHTIETTNKALEIKNRQVQDSIRYASRIQNSMLSNVESVMVNFKNYFILYHPKDIVSGDFYWGFQRNNIKIIAVGDCTGHGVPGAMLSILAISLLEHIVIEKNIMSLSLILENLDNDISKALNYGHDGLDISICLVDIEKKELIYSGAKNSIFYINNSKIEELKVSRFSIGGQTPQNTTKVFTTQTINYEQGDIVYLQTDGYKDQFGKDINRRFGSKALRGFLLDLQQFPITKHKDKLEENLLLWKKDAVQTDDITLVGIEL